MKYLYIKLMIVLIRIFDIIPFCLFKLFSSKLKKKYGVVNQLNRKQHSPNNNILIWMDYSGAIGDFFIILKSIVKLNTSHLHFSVLVHIRFKGIIEQLNLRNVTVIYKKNCLGNHYAKNSNDLKESLEKIKSEFAQKCLVFDKVYYFNGVLLADALTAIQYITYNKLIVIDPRVFLRGRKSMFIDRNFVNLSINYLISREFFNIYIHKLHNYKNYSLSEIFDEVMHTQHITPPITQTTDHGYTVITAGASNSSKVLTQNKLLEIIKQCVNNKHKIFVGSHFDEQFIPNIINNHFKEFEFKLDMSLLALFKLVQQAQQIISYDTGLYHMANFFEKQTFLIINEKDFAYRYMSQYWFGKTPIYQHHIILNKKWFGKNKNI